MENFSFIQINMNEFARIIESCTTIVPNNIFEIGSLNGNDAVFLCEFFSIDRKNVFVFEPHPVYNKNIKKKYSEINVFDYAIGDKDEDGVPFHAIRTDIKQNQGVSSLLSRNDNREYDITIVEKKRFDSVFNELTSEIDVLKIDVEGVSYEVLSGFGNKLRNVKIIHIECEHKEIWKGQKLYSDCERFLINNGFTMIELKIIWPQSDSVWINPVYLKKKWWENL